MNSIFNSEIFYAGYKNAAAFSTTNPQIVNKIIEKNFSDSKIYF